MDEQEPNPFATPSVAIESAIPEFDPDVQMRDFHFGKSLAKWMLICFVSGAPSFLIAFNLGPEYIFQAVAMASGIMTFVAVYVFIESREATRRMLMDRSLRIAVRVGYITRVAISVIFPVALIVDMFCGVFSVGITSSLLGGDFGPRPRGYDESQGLAFTFAWFYLTTLVQGVMLNIVLGAYTLIVYAFVLLFGGAKRSPVGN